VAGQRCSRQAPRPYQDWTHAAQDRVDLRRWWTDRLGGTEAQRVFTRDELSTWRWEPALGDPDPGIVISYGRR
jgi:hypothetical protein